MGWALLGIAIFIVLVATYRMLVRRGAFYPSGRWGFIADRSSEYSFETNPDGSTRRIHLGTHEITHEKLPVVIDALLSRTDFDFVTLCVDPDERVGFGLLRGSGYVELTTSLESERDRPSIEALRALMKRMGHESHRDEASKQLFQPEGGTTEFEYRFDLEPEGLRRICRAVLAEVFRVDESGAIFVRASKLMEGLGRPGAAWVKYRDPLDGIL